MLMSMRSSISIGVRGHIGGSYIAQDLDGGVGYTPTEWTILFLYTELSGHPIYGILNGRDIYSIG